MLVLSLELSYSWTAAPLKFESVLIGRTKMKMAADSLSAAIKFPESYA